MGVLVYTTASLPRTETVKRFQAHQEPLFVVYVGKAALGRQRDRLAHLHGETLGELIAKQEDGLLSEISPGLLTALADGGTRLRAAITQARQRIAQVVQDGPPTDYSPGAFEADCWALLRGIITSTVKWGDDKLKKAVPDGLFDFAYRRGKAGRTVRVWTYDAKLTERATGYDLVQAEKRKIQEYVSSAACSRRIDAFTQEEGFSGHLLISNPFNEKDFSPIREYMFKHNRKLAGQVKVRFLDVAALLQLSLLIDSHQAELQQRYDILLEGLDILMLGDEPHITSSDIERMLARVLQETPERPPLDTEAVADDIAR